MRKNKLLFLFFLLGLSVLSVAKEFIVPAQTVYNEEIIGLPEVEERDLSAPLTLRWSRKRKRWECRNAFFWQDAKNKWSCRSQDGRYYYGFRSLRALLKSYVGGLLCEKSHCYSAKNARAKYWFSQNPRRVTCCVTMRCTGFFPPSFPQGGMKL